MPETTIDPRIRRWEPEEQPNGKYDYVVEWQRAAKALKRELTAQEEQVIINRCVVAALTKGSQDDTERYREK